MTPQAWTAEVASREAINESSKLVAYPDPLSKRAKTGSGPGYPWTIGIGHCGSDVHEGLVWTPAQVLAAFQRDMQTHLVAARASLPAGIFNALSDARRYVIFDITFNMGPGPLGWGGFGATHALLTAAVHTKIPSTAHALYGEVADHLCASSWIAQTGDRARRGIAMMRSSNWCSPTGDGSDVL